MITSSFDNIRYIFEKTATENYPLQFNDTRTTPILNKSSEYKVAVENFVFSKYNVLPNILCYRFYTDTLPILDVSVSGQPNITKKLLFTYPFNNSTDTTSPFISFRADNYYWNELISNEPLKQINLYVNQVDINGNETPLFLYDLHYFSMTLLFQKK